jgi:hypothetical protein
MIRTPEIAGTELPGIDQSSRIRSAPDVSRSEVAGNGMVLLITLIESDVKLLAVTGSASVELTLALI